MMKGKLLKTNKKILAMIISLAMVIGVISAPQMVIPTHAADYSFVVDGLGYKILTDTTVEVARNLHKSKNIVIPKTVTNSGKTYTVTSIGRLAFDEQGVLYGDDVENPIESVVIPDTVTNIGSAAFEICYNLKSITIPDSVTSIGTDAFYYSGLTSVTLSKNLKCVDDRVFTGCKITEVTVPEGVEKIGEEAFGENNCLTKVTLPESLKDVDETAFVYTDNLKEIIAPMGATFILKDDRVMSFCDFTIESDHGTISLSGDMTKKEYLASNKARFWDTIKVTVTPEAGYKLQSLVIIDNDSNETRDVYENKFSVESAHFTIKATYVGQGVNNTSNGSAGTGNTASGIDNTNNVGAVGGNGSSGNTGSGNTGGNTTGTGSEATGSASGDASNGTTSTGTTYSSEWVNGKWYNADGSQTYEPTMSWKSNSTGWWIEDTSGWYPVSQWQKIDGSWYYFNANGYMASSEWRDGYYLSGSGALDYAPTASWYSDSNGWYFMDTSGWYPYSQWQKINGSWYYFDGSGYMVTSRYIEGYWIGADGVCN